MESLRGKRLVIFGCGYVGTAVAREALAAGVHVEALTRNAERAAALIKLGVGAVVADLATKSWHQRIAPAPEFVLDCVSSGGGCLDGYRRSYVGGVLSILDWARRGLLGTLVYTSSTSVYPQIGCALVDETASTAETGGTGRVLLDAEALIQNAGAVCDRWFILRLAGIYGPGRHHLLDQIRDAAVEIQGGGGHRLNLAHRDDIAAAVIAVFASAKEVRNRIFNVSDDAPATRAEVVQWLAAQVGRPAPRFTGGGASRGRGFPVLPDRLISNHRLKTELAWQPKYPSFREGYREILGGEVS